MMLVWDTGENASGQQSLLRPSPPDFHSAFLGLKEKYTDLSVTHSGAPYGKKTKKIRLLKHNLELAQDS